MESSTLYAISEDKRPPFLEGSESGAAVSVGDEHEVGGVPAIFTSPETGFGLGGAIVYIQPPRHEKRSSTLLGLLVTEKRQMVLGLYTTQSFAEDRLTSEAYFQIKEYPDYFYGVGDQTELDDKQAYVLGQRQGDVGIRYMFNKYVGLGLGFRGSNTFVRHPETGKLLGSGIVRGEEGGVARGIGLNLKYDDRDDQYSSREGALIELEWVRFGRILGGHYTFDRTILNIKKFFSLTSTSEVGVQVYTQSVAGDVPFFWLAQLGGSELLRGYYYGRYRDHNLMIGQAEYRQRLYKRLGVAVFTGAGDVAKTMGDFKLHQFKPMAGTGLRYQLTDKQRVNVRIDLSWAPHEQNPSMYLYLLEAF